MNRQQLAEAQQEVAAALTNIYGDDVRTFPLDPEDFEAMFSINLLNRSVRDTTLAMLSKIIQKHGMGYGLYIEDSDLRIDFGCLDDIVLDEEAEKWDMTEEAFAKYQAEGGEGTYEQWQKDKEELPFKK